MDTELLKRIVSKKTNVDLNNPKLNARRYKHLVVARNLYFKLCKDYFGKSMSLADIGKTITPNKDHSTVLYAYRVAQNHIETEQETADLYDSIVALVDYIKAKYESTPEKEALMLQLTDCDETIKKQDRIIQRQAQQYVKLQDRIRRQNRYLQEQGYDLDRSLFKNF